MAKYIDWEGFQENVEAYLKKHKGINAKMLKQLFDNYSENIVSDDSPPGSCGAKSIGGWCKGCDMKED